MGNQQDSTDLSADSGQIKQQDKYAHEGGHGRDDVTIASAHVHQPEKVSMDHAADRSAGTAVLEQGHLIPLTGERKVTKKVEVVSYCLMCELPLSCTHKFDVLLTYHVDIALTGLGPFNYMPAQLQNLLTQAFPDGFIHWGGQNTSSERRSSFNVPDRDTS